MEHEVTDNKQYQLFDSCRPRHTKRRIQFCLARRIETIVSDDETLRDLENDRSLSCNKNIQKKLSKRAYKKPCNLIVRH